MMFLLHLKLHTAAAHFCKQVSAVFFWKQVCNAKFFTGFVQIHVFLFHGKE